MRLYALAPSPRWSRRALRKRAGARGEPLAPLDGVPVTIKENIATEGVPLPLGTAAHRSGAAPKATRRRRPGCARPAPSCCQDHDARLRHAVLGPVELSPAVAQPLGLEQNPGGSSAGAGAAAAAGYGPLHVGTDIGGSVRLPAGWCGVFGLKPSLGRIPIEPPYVGRVAGPMTRDGDDAAMMMATLCCPTRATT